MAVYISSISSVSALPLPVKQTWTCAQSSKTPNYASCNLALQGATGTTSTNYNCNYDTTNEKWTCVKAKTSSGTPNQMSGSETVSKMTDSQIPLGLKGALQSMIQNGNFGSQMRQNNTQNSTSSEMRVKDLSSNTPPSQSLGETKQIQITGKSSAIQKSQNGSLVTGQSNTQVTNSSEMNVGNSPTPPQCPDTGPIPPDCTMKPPLK
jgi:hypothetical protein